MNIDKFNLYKIENLIDYLRSNSILDNPNFNLHIGRVDDRLNETNYEGILPEYKIIEELAALDKKGKLGSSVRAAFIKTPYWLVEKLGYSFNQQEVRGRYNYCWSTSMLDDVIYLDNDLNVFRCTYTVGRHNFKVGNLENQNFDNWRNHSLFNLSECLSCSLGGACSGGCFLSHLTDHDKQCKYENENFDKFINYFIIPNIDTRKMSN